MKNGGVKAIIYGLAMLLSSCLVSSCNCSPETPEVMIGHPVYDVLIENQTGQTLIVSTSQQAPKTVGPGEILIANWDTHSSGISITAKTLGEEAETYYGPNDEYPMVMIDESNYKVVIPPLEEWK